MGVAHILRHPHRFRHGGKLRKVRLASDVWRTLDAAMTAPSWLSPLSHLFLTPITRPNIFVDTRACRSEAFLSSARMRVCWPAKIYAYMMAKRDLHDQDRTARTLPVNAIQPGKLESRET